MKFLPKTFRDGLTLLFLAGILAGWYLKLLPSELNSAAVGWVGIILVFYYRKAGGSDANPTVPHG